MSYWDDDGRDAVPPVRVEAVVRPLGQCKFEVSLILMNTLNGSDKTVRTDDGFIRWGSVERRLHDAIERFWPNPTGQRPETQGENHE